MMHRRKYSHVLFLLLILLIKKRPDVSLSSSVYKWMTGFALQGGDQMCQSSGFLATGASQALTAPHN